MALTADQKKRFRRAIHRGTWKEIESVLQEIWEINDEAIERKKEDTQRNGSGPDEGE